MEVLDHFGLIDRELRLYIAVGNIHPLNGFIAYLKYVPTHSRTPWCRHGLCYERVVRYYSVENIKKVIENQRIEYFPQLGSYIPMLSLNQVYRIIDPRDVSERIVKHCNDELECIAAELVTYITNELSIASRSIGVTGSIMFGIHNPAVSDIDIVFYGYKTVEKVVKELSQLDMLSKPSNKRMNTIIENIMRLHRVDRKIAELVYSVPRRFVFHGVEVTVVYADDKAVDERRCVVWTQCVEAVIRSEGGDIGFLVYPARSTVFLEKFNNEVYGGIVEFLSFESVYSIPLYFGGRYIVKGALQLLDDGSYRLVLGVRECENYFKMS